MPLNAPQSVGIQIIGLFDFGEIILGWVFAIMVLKEDMQDLIDRLTTARSRIQALLERL